VFSGKEDPVTKTPAKSSDKGSSKPTAKSAVSVSAKAAKAPATAKSAPEPSAKPDKTAPAAKKTTALKAAPVKAAPVKAASKPASAKTPASIPPEKAPPKPPTKAATSAPKSAVATTKTTQASASNAEAAVPAPKVPIKMPTTATKVDTKLANAWKTKAGRDLTDAELMAMPDAEYMNDKQQEFFRTRLEALKDDLLSNAGETTEHLREDTSIVPDPADRATIEEEHALELRTRDRERKLLKKISQALARIESGDYGFCDETGEPIGLGRLIARPTATLSLEAQQRRELKQKMFGD
jgi:DnaK suppressor protein